MNPKPGGSMKERLAAMVALLIFKIFQVPIFWSGAKTVVLHWSRQIGKSYVLAAWAVYRILTMSVGDPAKGIEGRDWLVCVLSNSKDNGTEFMQKVGRVCRLLGVAFEAEDLSADEHIENMRIECRIKVFGHEGRIKVLAANPRTARGFSGDLILDEFAFHEDSYAIWDAAEPILSANPDFQCRIASTGNGTANMFYRLVAGARAVATAENPAGLCFSDAGMIVSRVSRSAAWALGQKIYDLKTGKEITPEQARAAALDKASYAQNYELAFNDAAARLLTDDAISGCEYQSEDECVICEGAWTPRALKFLGGLSGTLCFGMDVGRHRHLSTIAVGEKIGGIAFTRGILRMRETRLPKQKEEIARLFTLPNIGSGEIDMTGIGLGLVEFAQEAPEMGVHRVRGVNFSTKEDRNERQALIAASSGLPIDSAKVTELMGLDMLQAFEGRAIRIPHEDALRESLRKPEKMVKNNQVLIAAEDDDAGHADEFWAIALMLRALGTGPTLGIQQASDIRLGINQAMSMMATSGALHRATFTPRSLGTGYGRELPRLGTVPSTAVQQAINAVETSNLVRCSREEYRAEVRDALLAHAADHSGLKRRVRRDIIELEIARLDQVFGEPEEAVALLS